MGCSIPRWEKMVEHFWGVTVDVAIEERQVERWLPTRNETILDHVHDRVETALRHRMLAIFQRNWQRKFS